MKTKQFIKKDAVQSGELELINRYTRRELTADEVFVFSVVLCDNDIDRDCERFTVEGLEMLSELFVGKTGVFDHNPSAENQTARIFSCKVESVQGKRNSLGDDYFRLTARAYMPVTEGNAELRQLIDGGILREVSVGCAVKETLCSVCRRPLSDPGCTHKKGETYGGKLCFGELSEPYDAYEWSFVAVPAQRGAGIIKAYKKGEIDMNDILKSISEHKSISLTPEHCEKLCEYIDGLKKQAADGAVYRSFLVDEVMKLSAVVHPEFDSAAMRMVAKHMSTDELSALRKAYRDASQEVLPPKPQLFAAEKTDYDSSNGQFRI